MTPGQVRAIPGWEDSTEGEVQGLLTACAERWHRVGAMLIDGSKPAMGAMMVVSGEVQLLFEVGDMALPLEVFGPGHWIGLTSALDEGNEGLSARAVNDVRVLVMGREGIDRLRAQPSPISLRVYRAILQSQFQSMGKLSPTMAQVQRFQAEKRKLGKADLIAMGFSRLTQSAQVAAMAGKEPGRAVELVQHEGVAIAANFRAMR